MTKTPRSHLEARIRVLEAEARTLRAQLDDAHDSLEAVAAVTSLICTWAEQTDTQATHGFARIVLTTPTLRAIASTARSALPREDHR